VFSTTPFLADPGLPDFQLREEDSALHFATLADSIPLALPNASAASSSGEGSTRLLEVRCYSPDSCFATSPTSVLLVLPSLDSHIGGVEHSYSCRFGEQEVPAEEVTDGVIRFLTPPHQAGVVYFFLQRKRVTVTGCHVQLSVPLPFFFLAPVGDGRSSEGAIWWRCAFCTKEPSACVGVVCVCTCVYVCACVCVYEGYV
jgi:IPT/TIG domain